jgi:hypothetical protein
VRRWVSAVTFARAYNRLHSSEASVLQFFPMRPHPRSRITKIIALLNLRIAHGVRPDWPLIAWDTGTWFSARAAAALPAAAINGRCLDVSKSRVDAEWVRAGGQPLTLDPLVTDGLIVVKSELNSRHDGRIVRGPLRRTDQRHVYQRYVDCHEADSTVDLRTTVIAGEIVVVVRCYRPARRWDLPTTRMDRERPSDLYSAAELAQLRTFAAGMRLDYGELDVLRDRGSGLIYVVDANRTPYGPSPGMSSTEAGKVTALMADAFGRLLASRWP